MPTQSRWKVLLRANISQEVELTNFWVRRRMRTQDLGSVCHSQSTRAILNTVSILFKALSVIGRNRLLHHGETSDEKELDSIKAILYGKLTAAATPVTP